VTISEQLCAVRRWQSPTTFAIERVYYTSANINPSKDEEWCAAEKTLLHCAAAA
jgi:hypothetical protein